MALKPVKGKIQSQEINDNLSYLDSQKRDKNTPLELWETSQEFREAMTGGSVPVVGRNAVLTETIAPEQVTRDKTNFIEVASDNLFDKEDVLPNSGVSVNTGNPTNSTRNNLSNFIKINPSGSYTFFRVTTVAFYAENYDFISTQQLDQVEITAVAPSNAAYTRLVVSNANLPVAQMNEGATLKPYDEFRLKVKHLKTDEDDLIDGSVTTSKIKDDAITTNKRTPLGELATVIIGTSAPLPNIDTYNNKVFFNGTIWVSHRKVRYTAIDFEVPLDGAGAHQYVLFNIKTKAFRALRSSAESEIDENEVIIMVINRRNTHEIINVYATFDYTVNGKSLIDEKINTKVDEKIGEVPSSRDIAFSISLEDLNGWYNPSENETYDLFDYDTTTANELQIEFSNLANTYSDYITETNLGLDSSGDYNIYKYKLSPKKVDVTELNKPFPKILIVGGLHAGSEKASIFSVYYFIKDLCENWQSDLLLEYLRHNVEFVIIPNANPWGFDGGDYRRNFNMVDLNRNFDYRFSVHGEGTGTYTGPYAFSEIEAQYVRDMILENLDAMYFMDYHTNGSSGDEYHNLMWIPVPASPMSNYNVSNAARYTISKCTREFIKKYNQPNDVGFFGYISSGDTSRVARSYAASQGIPASTFECFRKFPNQAEYENPVALKACTEYFGNFIINVIKEFQSDNVKQFE